MVITNLLGKNANIQLNNIGKHKSKISRKLSSGYRINNASDDAAGLSISLKMKAQISGFLVDEKNINDGNSLFETAEGAMEEISSMLQRIRELAIQSANDTNTDEDRKKLQDEVSQLIEGIDNITENTEFNTIKILQGSYDLVSEEDLSEQTMNKLFNINSQNRWGASLDFSKINSSNKSNLIGKDFHVTCSQNCDQIFSFQFVAGDAMVSEINGDSLNIKVGIENEDFKKGSDIIKAIVEEAQKKEIDRGFDITDGITQIGHANALAQQGSQIIFYSLNGFTSTPPVYSSGMGTVFADELNINIDNPFNLQIGPNAGNLMEAILPSTFLKNLHISNLSVSDRKMLKIP